jgi:hypothetical protein
MFPAVQLQRTARRPPPPPRSRTLPRLILKAQRLSPPSPSPLALVRLHRRPPRRHFQALRVTPRVVRFITSQKQCHNHLHLSTPELTFFLVFSFVPFPRPHTSNCVVTNCLTDAVAQVNCSSITAVACFCTNQYVNRHLLSLLIRVISPYSHPLSTTKTGHSQPHSTRVSHPIAARTCPQRKALPSDSARSTTSRSPSRLPPLCPPHHLPPRQQRSRRPLPAQRRLMRRAQRPGCPMGVDGVAWLLRRVAPFLAPRFYSPIGQIISIVQRSGETGFSIPLLSLSPFFAT